MPVDTQNKRRSAGVHPALAVLPVPDGAIDVADRAHVSWVYAGLAIAPPPIWAFGEILRLHQVAVAGPAFSAVAVAGSGLVDLRVAGPVLEDLMLTGGGPP